MPENKNASGGKSEGGRGRNRSVIKVTGALSHMKRPALTGLRCRLHRLTWDLSGFNDAPLCLRAIMDHSDSVWYHPARVGHWKDLT